MTHIVFSKGEFVNYSYKVKEGKVVSVVAEIIDTYSDLYCVGVDECSIRFKYLGDTITIHGVDVATLQKKGGRK